MNAQRIERARRADLPELARVAQTVHAHSFADLLSPAALRRDIEGPLSAWHLRMQARSDLFLVARRKGVMQGLAQVGVCDTPAEDLWLPCMLSPGALELRRIYVLPTAQGQGIGSALLEAAIEVAGQAGADMLLDVWAGNTSAQRLYAPRRVRLLWQPHAAPGYPCAPTWRQPGSDHDPAPSGPYRPTSQGARLVLD